MRGSSLSGILWDFLVREWLLTGAAAGLVLSSLYLHTLPAYSWKDLRPVALLAVLFVVIKGLERSRLLDAVALRMERGSFLAPRLVALAFVLSAFLTIDATLVTLLPLVLRMRVRRRIPLTILVALTAHLGAALTPFGTPQNLFIFAWYQVEVLEFLRVMAPFSFGLFGLFFALSFFLHASAIEGEERRGPAVAVWEATLYGVFFLLAVGAVLGFVPLWAAALVILFAFLLDVPSLKIDYPLLLTFVVFIGLTGNIRQIIDGSLSGIGHTYLLSAGMSQFISNVPATLILERFTEHWRSLLWGVNAGSFGTPVAALANLITYRLYLAYGEAENAGRFLLWFTIAGFATLLIATGMHEYFFDFIHYYVE
ncbi:SLC13 family permease [Nitratifractor sp.]